jgi:predicted HAD superfamily phosphohydrolase YqeG
MRGLVLMDIDNTLVHTIKESAQRSVKAMWSGLTQHKYTRNDYPPYITNVQPHLTDLMEYLRHSKFDMIITSLGSKGHVQFICQQLKLSPIGVFDKEHFRIGDSGYFLNIFDLTLYKA